MKNTHVKSDSPPHVKSWLIGKDSDAGRGWGQEEKGMTEDEMAGSHHRLDGHEFEWTLGVGDGQGGLACCDSWGRKELDTTVRLNWTELYICSLPLESSSHLPPFSTPPSCYRAPVWVPESYSKFPLAIYFTYVNVYKAFSVLFVKNIYLSLTAVLILVVVTCSQVVACGLNRFSACGILPNLGLNPRPLHWQADTQPLDHHGSPH